MHNIFIISSVMRYEKFARNIYLTDHCAFGGGFHTGLGFGRWSRRLPC